MLLRIRVTLQSLVTQTGGAGIQNQALHLQIPFHSSSFLDESDLQQGNDSLILTVPRQMTPVFSLSSKSSLSRVTVKKP